MQKRDYLADIWMVFMISAGTYMVARMGKLVHVNHTEALIVAGIAGAVMVVLLLVLD